MQTKKSIKKIQLTIFAIFLFQISFCQENYLAGQIFQLNGDTLHGFIDYRNWKGNPDKISFKVKISDTALIYSPTEIKGFGVLDEFYESAIIETEVSPKYIGSISDELYYNADLNIEIDTTFLQTIIKGEKSLYFYMNKIGKYQFYINQDSSYKLLIYKKYLVRTKENQGITENKQYQNQLSAFFQDCPTIQSRIRNTTYAKKSMESLFLYYYDCTQSKFEFQKETEKVFAEFGVFAGLSLATLKFDVYDYLINADCQSSASFTTGVFFEVISPRNLQKWSLNNELIYSSYEIEGEYNDYKNENDYTLYNTTIGYSYLKMNNMVRYKYKIGNCFLFFNAGISNGFAISEKNYLKKELKRYMVDRIDEGKALTETRKYEQGFLFGVGTKHKNVSFEIRCEKGNGMSVSPNLRSKTTRYYFLLGYKI